MKQIRGAVGADREALRLATQAEVDSVRDNDTFEEAAAAELKEFHYHDRLTTDDPDYHARTKCGYMTTTDGFDYL